MPKRLTKEDHFQRYLDRFPHNPYNLTPEDFSQQWLLQWFECPEHGPFQIEPVLLTKQSSGCKECGKIAISAASSARMQEMWKDPEFRERTSARMSATVKALWEDPEFREKMSATMKEKWEDLEYREMMGQISASNGYLDGPSKNVVLIADLLRDWGIGFQGGDDLENEYVIPGTAYCFDFYILEYGLFIEYHGIQHYEHIPYFHETYEDFLDGQDRDQWKADWATANGFRLEVISYKDDVAAKLRMIFCF